jgi:hypothetical protein
MDFIITVGIRGHQAIVDPEDYEMLNQYKWSLSPYGYACRNQREKGKYVAHIAMHRVIMNAPEGVHVDHINGDRLDNRKVNLRLATHQENLRNRGKTKRNGSGFKGVIAERGKWRAEIKKEKVNVFLGYYYHPLEAAMVFNKAAAEYHGEFAHLNKFTPEQQAGLEHWLQNKPQLSSSRFKGVHYYKARGNWQAYINKDKKRRSLGYFTTEEEAARVYNAAALELYGDNAKLNPI